MPQAAWLCRLADQRAEALTDSLLFAVLNMSALNSWRRMSNDVARVMTTIALAVFATMTSGCRTASRPKQTASEMKAEYDSLNAWMAKIPKPICGSVVGIVVAREPMRKVAGVRIKLERNGQVVTTKTDRDGLFSAAIEPGDDWRLFVERRGSGMRGAMFWLSSADNASLVQVHLTATRNRSFLQVEGTPCSKLWPLNHAHASERAAP